MTTLETVTSADGTRIAFERRGDGPAVILIGGAFNDRSTVAALATTLPGHTTLAYDRRGRGDSDLAPGDGFAVEREIEDLAALIAAAGGSAHLFGHSSGAVLALEAAAAGLPVGRLAAYEPPYVVGDARPRAAGDLLDRVRAHVEADRRDEAVTLFMTEAIGMPPPVVARLSAGESWGWFTGLAHTLPYDLTACGPGSALPADRLAKITVPTLVLSGGESPGWMREAARAVADAVPGGRYVTVEGEDHGVLRRPDALLPQLTGFYG